MDIAELGYRVDTSSVRRGTVDLDKHGDQAAQTERQAVRSASRMSQAYAGASRAARGLNGALASGGSRMLTQQLSQVAQQATATGNVLQAFAVQAADIGLAFGVYGTIIGAAVGVLLPLAGQFFNNASAAGEFQEALDRLKESTSEARAQLELLNSGLGSMEQLAVQQEINRLIEERDALLARASTQTGRNARGSELQAAREITEIERLQTQIQENQNALQELANIEARELLTSLEREIDLERAIADFGRESAVVASTRARLEREVFEEKVNSLNASEGLAAALNDAFINKQNLVSLNAARDLAEAADHAARLAQNLAIARGRATDQAVGGNVDFFDERNEAGLSGVILRPRGVPRENRPGFVAPTSRRSGGGGGGQSEAARQYASELNEVRSILERAKTAAEQYQEQIDLIDGVYERGQISAAEYASATSLIRQEFEETKWEDFRRGIDDISSSFVDAAASGESFGDAVVDSLKRIVAQQAAQQLSGGLNTIGAALFPNFAGFFDSGGNIPAGQFGVVGERGPELVSGPASVTSRVDTARMLNGQNGNVTIVQHLNLSMGATEAAQAEVAKAAPKIRDSAIQGVLAAQRRGVKA